MNRSSLISSIYKSRNSILEQLEMQGYDITNYKSIDINEINSAYENSLLDMIVEKKEEDVEDGQEFKGERESINKKLYVHYSIDGKLSQSKIQTLIDDLFITEEILGINDTLFIISDSDPNTTINNFVHHIWEKDKIFVVIQSIRRLKFNVLLHDLQPKFRILDDLEANDVRKTYNIIDDKNFPEISRFDPVCKATFIRPGQIFEVLRPSRSAVVSKYYLMCISISQ
jgi:DNA-directed RNA polymerase subunit H (RpoH/RPB5)